MKSIKLKLVLIYLALVFIVITISGTFMLTNVKLQETEKAHKNLQSYSRQIKEQIIDIYNQEDFQEGFENLDFLIGNPLSIEGNILNKFGQTLASNMSTEMLYVDTTIITAMNGASSFSTGKSLSVIGENKSYINYAFPINISGSEAEYIIFTRFDQEQILETLTKFVITLFLTVILALIMTGFLGFLFANTLTDPIIILTKKAKQIALGNLNEKIPVNSKDEIGQLTESFNNMSSDLSKTIGSMISEKNKLEILLHNMTDGVLAYDNNENIIHANDYFYELLGLNYKSDTSFKRIMGLLEVEVNHIEGLWNKPIIDKYIAIKDKYINVSFATYLNNNSKIEGILIVLQDITKHKKLDNMRKEFVANVSHEIRTPLTTIKSYSETLLDGALEDYDTSRNFLTVINSEADRMTLLVKDLLELSSFDSNQLTLTMTKIDLNYIIQQCITQLTILARNKNQNLNYEKSENQFLIMGDQFRINQVITNIISNSIKYSHNDSDIEISVSTTSKYFTLLIKDYGMGIPKEDLNRIFERFFRVDKARSRAMGGTGLGLAISKEIMEIHKGSIYATSQIGKGTTMVLKFIKMDSDKI
jgi:two-component system, OmpR family, sensor histidine kinase VicK